MNPITHTKEDWQAISSCQFLSERFIMENIHNLNFQKIVKTQILSEDFILKFIPQIEKQNLWCTVLRYQSLSERFIEENLLDKSDIIWSCICMYQTLSESFMRKYPKKVDFGILPYYQKLSDEFLWDFGIIKPRIWLYATKEEKLTALKTSKNFRIVDDDYFFAYKTTRKLGVGSNPPYFKYEVGKTYERKCTCCGIHDDDMLGLYVRPIQYYLSYDHDGEIYEVKVNIDDLGIFMNKNLIKCSKFEVVDRIV